MNCMNRPIKFRAWLNMQEEMLYANIFGAGELFAGRDCQIMQYTGLKDKNGKEIYEGDIVNIDGLIVPVIWYAGAWMVEYFTIPTKSYLSHFDELDVEIIGNKYENTELLSGN